MRLGHDAQSNCSAVGARICTHGFAAYAQRFANSMLQALQIMLVMVALGDPKPGLGIHLPDLAVPPKPVGTTAMAVRGALEYLEKVPPAERPFKRFFWVPGANLDRVAALTFVLNEAVSHAPVEMRPLVYKEVVIADLRQLSSSTAQLKKTVAVLESLAVREPYFTVRAAINGKDAIAVPAPHLGPDGVLLSQQTASAVPIFHYGWFVRLATTTLDGGVYYDLRGIKGMKQAEYLASRGASEEQVASLQSDERSAIAFSLVTGKPRRIDVFRAAGVRPSRGTGLVSVTHDIRDGDIKADEHPLRNLLTFKDAAREVILELPSGFHEYTLFDGNGNLQNSAPDDIVVDHLVPAPYTKRLQGMISCVRCHGADEGWKPFGNDVKAALGGGNGNLDVFADANGGVDQIAAIQRLAGLYSGDLSLALKLGRNSYQDVVFRTTGGRELTAVSKSVADTFADYAYTLVTPLVACRELGYEITPVKDGDTAGGAVQLQRILPPVDPGNGTPTLEDVTIGLLKRNVPVTRIDWEFVFAEAALRVARATEDAETVKRIEERVKQKSAGRKAGEPVQLAAHEREAFAALNQFRQSEGLPPFKVSSLLQASSRARVTKLAATGGQGEANGENEAIAHKFAVLRDALPVLLAKANAGAALRSKASYCGVAGAKDKENQVWWVIQVGQEP